MSKPTNNDPINVCFIAPKTYPLFNTQVRSVFGGAEVDLYLLSTELANDSLFNVSFITADYGQDETEVIENVTIVKSFKFEQSMLTSTFRLWQALYKADADIYFVETASIGVYLVSLFCRIKNKYFVYRTAHQDECDGTYISQSMITGRLFKNAVKNTDLLITQNIEDSVNIKNTTGMSSVTIPNGHRIKEVSDTRKNSIIWVGRSAQFKRPERFLALAEKFPSEKFIMICQRATGDDEYDSLQKKASAIVNLEFIERVPFHEIDSYFDEAKLLVNTSDSEGFSNTFNQACKAATAIVSYTVNPDKFLTAYDCGICCDSSQTKMEEAVRHLLQDSRYIDFGKNGRKIMEQKYDIQKITEEYKKHFYRIASR